MFRPPRWFGKARFEHDMEQEMQFHLERRTEGLVATGLSQEDARRKARLEFGALDAAKEESRSASGFGLRPFG